jgi:hypothetical protein
MSCSISFSWLELPEDFLCPWCGPGMWKSIVGTGLVERSAEGVILGLEGCGEGWVGSGRVGMLTEAWDSWADGLEIWLGRVVGSVGFSMVWLS